MCLVLSKWLNLLCCTGPSKFGFVTSVMPTGMVINQGKRVITQGCAPQAFTCKDLAGQCLATICSTIGGLFHQEISL